MNVNVGTVDRIARVVLDALPAATDSRRTDGLATPHGPL